MIDGAVWSGSSGGANIVVRIQSANRWDQLYIIVLTLKLGIDFLQHIDICLVLACYYAKGIESGYLFIRISFQSNISKHTTRFAQICFA